jgi:hypothetical protein
MAFEGLVYVLGDIKSKGFVGVRGENILKDRKILESRRMSQSLLKNLKVDIGDMLSKSIIWIGKELLIYEVKKTFFRRIWSIFWRIPFPLSAIRKASIIR